MTTTEIQKRNTNAAAIVESVVVRGDLAKLSEAERVAYYKQVCESLGLNPLTRPFDYITLNGRLTLYAKRDAADQLRKIHGVSIDPPQVQIEDGLAIVSVTARDASGRTDSEIGAVAIDGLRGEARANALMKAITKAKRRVTLSLCGLGWLDETEIETVPDARPVTVDTDTGEIREAAPKPAAERPELSEAEKQARRVLYDDLRDALAGIGVSGNAAGQWLAERFGGRSKLSQLTIDELTEAVKMATEAGQETGELLLETEEVAG